MRTFRHIAVTACFLFAASVVLPGACIGQQNLQPFDAALGGQPDWIRKAFVRSIEHETNGDYQQAIDELIRLPMQSQVDYPVHLRLGWLYYLSGDYPTSEWHYQEAIAALPQAIEPRLGHLLPVLAQGRYAEAETIAGQLASIEPDNYYANLRLAYALRMQGKYEAAVPVCQHALRVVPDDATLLAELALDHQGLQQHENARQLAQQILFIDGNNATANQILGLGPVGLPDTIEQPAYEPALNSISRSFRVSPYYAYLDYGSKSIKASGHTGGVYACLANVDLWEIAVDTTSLSFRDGSHLRQLDFTAAYSFLRTPNWKLRVGGHVIDNNDALSDGSWIVMLSGHYYQTAVWDIGVDTYYSRYDRQTTKNIVQLTPHLGFQRAISDYASVRLDLHGYYINTERTLPNLPRKDLYSGEMRLSLISDPLSIALFGWGGDQAFAVRKDGFVVFNLAEHHTGGLGTEIRYALSDRTSLTTRVALERFADLANGESTNQLAAVAILSHTF